MHTRYQLITAAVFLLATSHVYAISKDIVERTKSAIAYIEVDDGSGSAFQIDPAGYFITNEHVVEGNKTVKLVLNSGEANQETVTGHVVRIDKDLDFALIKADKPARGTLTFGQNADLYETLPITAFGFPLGKDILLGADGSPTVSINTGHISALRQDKNGLEMIQIDADVNPGNSGGPVVDDQGHVVGVVEAGIEGAAGINLAIPIGTLKSFLYRPDVSITPKNVSDRKETEVTKFEVNVTSFNSAFKPGTVDVTLQAPSLPDRTFSATLQSGGSYAFSTQLIPKPQGPKHVHLSMISGGASIDGDAVDVPIRIGAVSYNLSDFKQVSPSGSAPSELKTGVSVSGHISGLPTISVTISGMKAVVDLRGVDTIDITPSDKRIDTVHYRIRVSSSNASPIVTEGDITVGNSEAPSHGRPPELSVRTISNGIAPAPIDVTGYNANVVTPHTKQSVDAADYGVDGWFESGAVDDDGNKHDDGLVAGTLVSGCQNSVTGGNTVFWIQPFDRQNALRLGNGGDNSGTFRLRQTKKYRVLSVLACAYSAQPNSTGSLVLTFTDGSHSSPISFNACDWCTGWADKAVADRGRNEGVKRDGTGFKYVNQPSANLFETDVDLSKLNLADKVLQSIAFTGTGDGLHDHSSTNVFAVSGVPE